MFDKEMWEVASFAVTVIGLPVAILIFVYQARRERANAQPHSGSGGTLLVIFDMLIAFFERAYLVAYAPHLPPAMARRWNSWEDFMRVSADN